MVFCLLNNQTNVGNETKKNSDQSHTFKKISRKIVFKNILDPISFVEYKYFKANQKLKLGKEL